MTMLPRYKMTEEVVRQAVEVAFKRDARWEIAFTNPTAGPWKLIRLGQYTGGGDLRYRKEEDRPDLMLYSSLSRLLLVLEAKDDIRHLTVAQVSNGVSIHAQLEKSVEVFAKEFRRFDSILANPQTASLAFGSAHDTAGITLLCGYIYAQVGARVAESQTRLHQIHFQLASGNGDARLLPCLDIVVSQDLVLDLSTRATMIGGDSQLLSLLQQALPANLLTN